jgi:hypothetical protein
VNPVERIRQILKGNERKTGTVVAADSQNVTVATTKGVLTMQRLPGDATAYRQGDTAVLSGGKVVGRRRGSPPVYVV